MSFTLATGGQGTVATAQVVWSFTGQTYTFRSDNNFLSWITTIFTIADAVTSGLLTNPLVLPNNTNANGWSLNTIDNGGTGGSITMLGELGDSAGNINMNAGYDPNAPSGSINLSGGGENAGGGSILMVGGGQNAPAGSINTSGFITPAFSLGIGGSINTYGGEIGNGGNISTFGDTDFGGSINTSDGGGSINTRGVGSIQLGEIGTRTTLNGSATVARTITLPDTTGTLIVGSASATAGGVAVGEYLEIYYGGVQRKIALLLP